MPASAAFEDITIRDVCAAAQVSLADYRDAFPSKGAILAGFSRRIDRAVLEGTTDDLMGEPARDRLFDVLMRRLDAMAPYRAALREIAAWVRRDPIAAYRMNQAVLNSMRFMLEAAGIDSEGSTGALKLQGLVIAWARIMDIWLEDSEPELSRTMAALDRELTRGEKMVQGIEQLDRLASPLKAIARAAMDARSRARDSFRRRPGESASSEDAPAA